MTWLGERGELGVGDMGVNVMQGDHRQPWNSTQTSVCRGRRTCVPLGHLVRPLTPLIGRGKQAIDVFGTKPDCPACAVGG